MTLPYNKDEWRASVKNGQIPRNLLDETDPTQFDDDLGGPAIMHPEAAAAMSALLAHARQDGLQFRVRFSYRTLAKQQEKWRSFQNGGNLAATPGTSNHGWAVSDDLTDLGENDISWLRRNAERYGYANDVPSEIWHWTYQGGFEGQGDDVFAELYSAGWDKYIERYDEQDGDPGPAPPDREEAFKKGWSHARKAMNNPKRD